MDLIEKIETIRMKIKTSQTSKGLIYNLAKLRRIEGLNL
jgi:hypothetical protein